MKMFERPVEKKNGKELLCAIVVCLLETWTAGTQSARIFIIY